MHLEDLLHMYPVVKPLHRSINRTRFRQIGCTNPKIGAIYPRKATPQIDPSEVILFKSKVPAKILPSESLVSNLVEKT